MAEVRAPFGSCSVPGFFAGANDFGGLLWEPGHVVSGRYGPALREALRSPMGREWPLALAAAGQSGIPISVSPALFDHTRKFPFSLALGFSYYRSFLLLHSAAGTRVGCHPNSQVFLNHSVSMAMMGLG